MKHNGYFKRARMPGQVHLSLSQSRTLLAEMPIGDPVGGASYGRMEMPVVVVAMAAGSFAAGAAAFAAATSVVGAVAAGALMVGSALTIAGTITGNQKLTKIGGIISLVGGIGSIANSLASGASGAAGAAGEAVAGTAADAAADAAGGALADAAAGTAADAITGLAAPAADIGGSVLEGAASAATASAAPAASAAADAATSAAASAGADAATQAAAQAAQSTSPFTSNVTNAFSPTSASSAFAAPTSNNLLGGLESFDYGTSAAFNPASQSTGLMGYFDKAGQWIKSNPQLTKIGLDTIGSAATSLSPSAATKATTNLTNAQASKLKQQQEEERVRQLWRQGRIS